MKYVLITLLSIVSFALLSQQNEVDSLKSILKQTTNDTTKCRLLDLLTEMASDEEWPKFNLQLKSLCELNLKKSSPGSKEYKIYSKYLGNAINNMGIIALQNNDLEKAIDYFKNSLAYMQQADDKAGIASNLNNLGRMYERTGKKTEALDYFQKCLKLKEEIKDHKGIATCFTNIASVYRNFGEIDKSLEYHKKSLKISEAINDLHGIANSFNALGVTFYELGNIMSALDNYHKSLKIQEQIKDSVGIANSFNNIGLLYYNQSDPEKALEYYHKSLSIQEKIKDYEGIAYSLNNIGYIYHEQKKHDKALDYFNRSLKIRESMQDKNGISVSYINIGLVYKVRNDYTKALDYFHKSLALQEEIQDKLGITRSLINIGGIYLNKKEYKKAIQFCERSLELSKELGYPESIRIAAQRLTSIFKETGDDKKALKYFELYIQMRDSLENEETRKASVRSQFKYTYEKKAIEDSIAHAKESELQNLVLKQQESELRAKRNQQYALYGGLALVMVFAGFMYNRFKVTQQQKKIIEDKEIETQKQNKIINYQKLVVEEKQREILDSINYAKRIQYTLLAHEDFLKENIPNHFVFFHPKDIVSGDFYWATKRGNKFYLAVCDSTGHGVPGAFMSLLNISFLNESVNEKGIEEPNKVFDFVRQRLIDNISKEGQKDGFDGILICIETLPPPKGEGTGVRSKITYVAANNTPLLISRASTSSASAQLIELDSNRMPVGMGERKEDFKLYSIDAKAGDTLYLYTDGYADQFGGPKGKKFKYKQLNEMLLANADKPLETQKSELKNTFDVWKGNLEQVDDVCIIGIRL